MSLTKKGFKILEPSLSVTYLNRSSPNQDLIKEFLERYALTEEGLTPMDQAKPIGVPALMSLYEKMIKDNPLLRQLKVSVDYGEVMPNIPRMGRLFSAVGAADALEIPFLMASLTIRS